MLDTFVIRVENGTEYDDFLQEDVTQWLDLFTTKGRVKVGGGIAANDAEVGGRTAIEVRRELDIPANSPKVPADAVAFCVAADPTSDPTLLGAGLRVAGPAPGSQQTARRLQVSEVIS